MQQIIQEGLDIGEWATKKITNLNFIYIEIDNQLCLGYRMYERGLLVEAFILFMRVTRLFDIINIHKHLIVLNKRHLYLKGELTNIINIMEYIKPKLMCEYESIHFPTVPNSKVKTLVNSVSSIDDLEISKINHTLDLRWKKFKDTIRSPPKQTPTFSQPVEIPLQANITYLTTEGKPLDALSILRQHLTQRNLRMVDVPGDNNCQFHAIIDQLHHIGIKGWHAAYLRRKTVEWLKINANQPMDDGKVGSKTLLKDAVGVENWEQYLTTMSQHGVTWGDEATLLAIATMFKLKIIIISSLPNDYCHEIKPPDFWNVPIKNTINLGHYHEFHYVSTAPL